MHLLVIYNISSSQTMVQRACACTGSKLMPLTSNQVSNMASSTSDSFVLCFLLLCRLLLPSAPNLVVNLLWMCMELCGFVQVNAQMEPPVEMLMPLLPFQKEFLAWAISQEQGVIKGGILADEMGMGKTIQVSDVACCRRTSCGPAIAWSEGR